MHQNERARTTATDADLARAWSSGDRDALAVIYDRYGEALYGFARSRTRSDADAADVVQDVFVRAAQRLGQLRDPSSLRSWLFTIARNVVIDRGRRSREVSTDPLDDIDGFDRREGRSPAADTVVQRGELGELVWMAAEALNERDREVLELHVRHGLESNELAAVLGLGNAHAATILNRVKDRMAVAVGSLLVARHARRDCERLAALLAGWDGRFTLEVRAQVTRHVEGCDECGRRRALLVAPGAFTAGAMALPAIAPLGLRERVLAATPTPAPLPHLRSPRTARRRRLVTSLGVVVVAVATVIVLVNGREAGRVSAPPSTVAATAPPTTGADAPTAPSLVPPSGPTSTTIEPTPAPVADGTSPVDVESRPDPDPSKATLPVGGPRPTVITIAVVPPTSTTVLANPAAPGTTAGPTGASSPAGNSPPVTVSSGGGTAPATSAPSASVPPATPPPSAPPPAAPASFAVSTALVDLGTGASRADITITNQGGSTGSWSASSSASPLSLVPASGQLAPGQSGVVSVQIDRTAMPEGSTSYVASIVAGPGGSGGGNVTVTARVERGPVVTGIVRSPELVRTSGSCGSTTSSITVSATDESAVAKVEVLWSANGSLATRTSLSASGPSWTGVIGPFTATGTASLSIDVFDTRGNRTRTTSSLTVLAC